MLLFFLVFLCLISLVEGVGTIVLGVVTAGNSLPLPPWPYNTTTENAVVQLTCWTNELLAVKFTLQYYEDTGYQKYSNYTKIRQFSPSAPQTGITWSADCPIGSVYCYANATFDCTPGAIGGPYILQYTLEPLGLGGGQWLVNLTTLPVPAPAPILGAAAGTGSWNVSAWSACDRTCGGGSQFRTVDCIIGDQIVGSAYCTQAQPPIIRLCNTQNCPTVFMKAYEWNQYNCIQQCPGTGVLNQRAIAECTNPDGSPNSSTDTSICPLVAPQTFTCIAPGTTCGWKAGNFSTCSGGIQTRMVECWDNRMNRVFDANCPNQSAKPKYMRACIGDPTLTNTPIPWDTTLTTFTLTGTNFDATDWSNNIIVITFTGGVGTLPTGSITSVHASGTSLTYTFSQPLTVDFVNKQLFVTLSNGNTNWANQITLTQPITLAAPTLQSNYAPCDTELRVLTVYGTSFNPVPANNTVTITMAGNATAPTGVVSYVNALGTVLHINITRLNTNVVLPPQQIRVQVHNGFFSSNVAQQTDICEIGVPTLTNSSFALNTSTPTITLTGFSFHPIATSNVFTFSLSGLSGGTPPTGVGVSVSGGGTQVVVALQNLPFYTNAVGRYLEARLYNSKWNSNVARVSDVITLAEPTVNPTAFGLSTSTPEIIISGTNFNYYANNTVTFSAAQGTPPAPVTVTSDPAGRQLVATFLDSLNTDLIGQTLMASVHNTISASSSITISAPITLGTPVVLINNLSVNTAMTSINITGANFHPTPGNNTVVITSSGGTAPTGTVTSVGGGGKWAIISLSPLKSDLVGFTLSVALHNGISTTTPKVVTAATTLGVPTITSSSASIDTDSLTFNIMGGSFSLNPSTNVVYLQTSGGHAIDATATAVLNTGLGLTITLDGPLDVNWVGETIHAIVYNGVANSSSIAVTGQIQLGVPTIISSTLSITTDATSISITGSNLNAKTPSNNVVTFTSSGGTPPAATTTSVGADGKSATVTFTGRLYTDLVGRTLSIALNNGYKSTSAPTLVVTSITIGVPVITPSTQLITTSSSQLTLSGFNFHQTLSSNNVNLESSGGASLAALGAVTNVSADGTTATFTFNDTLSTTLLGQTLTVQLDNTNVAKSTREIVSAAITLGVPVVKVGASALATSATSLTINGGSFDPTPSNNVIALTSTGGTTPSALVTSVDADGKSMVATFQAPLNTDLVGFVLLGVCTHASGNSGSPRTLTAAITLAAPTVSVGNQAITTDSTTITVLGTNFASTPASNVLTFTGATGATVSAHVTSVELGGRRLVIQFDGRLSTSLIGEPLSLVVNNGAGTSGAPVFVSTAVTLAAPTVIAQSPVMFTGNSSLTIFGTNFHPNASANSVSFAASGAGTPPTGSVTSVGGGGTSAVITFSGPLNTNLVGNNLTLTFNNTIQTASAVVTAVIQLSPPILTLTTPPVDTSATTLTLTGQNFDSNPASNLVTFSLSTGTAPIPTGTVTAVNGGGTQAIVSVTRLSTQLLGKHLLASISNGAGSTAAVQVTGSITLGEPTVTPSQVHLTTDSTSINVTGTNFHPVAGTNVVTFSTTGLAPMGTVVWVDEMGTSAMINFTGRLFSSLAGQELAVLWNNTFLTSQTAITVTDAISLADPTVVASSTPHETGSRSLTITGTNFNANKTANTITITSTGGTAPTGSVSSVESSGLLLVIEFDDYLSTDLVGYVLQVSVNNGNPTSSPFVTVTAPITLSAPTIYAGSAPLVTDSTSITIFGRDFAPTPSQNVPTFTTEKGGTAPTGTVTSVGPNGTSAVITFNGRLNTNLVNDRLRLILDNGRSSLVPVTISDYIVLSDPTVTASSFALQTSDTTFAITGTNFNSVPGNNLVTITTSGGTAPTATVTSILNGGQGAVLTFDQHLYSNLAGFVMSVVLSNGNPTNSGTKVVSAAITLSVPTVTTSNQSLSTDATSIVIRGFNFANVYLLNYVVFSSSGGAIAPNGSVTYVSSDGSGTQLNVTFGGRLDTSLVGQTLYAVINNGRSSGTPVAVTGVITLGAPTLTPSNLPISTSTTTLTLSGFNFNSVPSQNTIQFTTSLGGSGPTAPTGHVVSVGSGGRSVVVAFDESIDTAFEGAYFSVEVDNGIVSSGIQRITATITLADPVVTYATPPFNLNAVDITITGANFAANPSTNQVQITSTGGTPPSATVTAVMDRGTSAVLSLSPLPLNGDLVGQQLLVALDNGNGKGFSAAVPVTGVIALPAPNVTPGSDPLTTDSTSITIFGSNFNLVPSINTVTFSSSMGSGTPPTGYVSAVSPDGFQLVVTFSNRLNTNLVNGTLSAVVKNGNAQDSGSVVVSGVIEIAAPTITPSATAITTDTLTIVITGTNFDAIASDNDVVVYASGNLTHPLPNSITAISGGGTSATIQLQERLKTELVGQHLVAKFRNSLGTYSGEVAITASITLADPSISVSSQPCTTDTILLTINGLNFNSNASANTVVLFAGRGTSPTGTVTSVTNGGTQAVITLNGRLNTDTIGGAILVILDNGNGPSHTSSSPVVITSTITLAAPTVIETLTPFTTNDLTLTVYGTNFAPNYFDNTVTFSSTGTGTPPTGHVTGISGGEIATVTLTAPLNPDLFNTSLTIKWNNGVAETSAFVIVTDRIMLGAPLLLTNNVPLTTDDKTLTINGYNFNTVPDQNVVYFNTLSGGASAYVPIGTVTSVTNGGQQAVVTFVEINVHLVSQKLQCILFNGVLNSTKVTVTGSILLGAPTITATPNATFTTGSLLLTILGTNFYPVASTNKVTLTDSIQGRVIPASNLYITSVNDNGTMLVVSLVSYLDPSFAGAQLLAVVDNGAGTSGAAVAITDVITQPACGSCNVFVSLSSTGHNGQYILQSTTISGKPYYTSVSGVNLYSGVGQWFLDYDLDSTNVLDYSPSSAACPTQITEPWVTGVTQIESECEGTCSSCAIVVTGSIQNSDLNRKYPLAATTLNGKNYYSSQGYHLYGTYGKWYFDSDTNATNGYYGFINWEAQCPQNINKTLAGSWQVETVGGPSTDLGLTISVDCTATCTDGAINGDEVDVDCGGSCSACAYSIGGSLTGLAGTGLVIRNVLTDLSLTQDGTWVFPYPFNRGFHYDIVVVTQPTGSDCTVYFGSGQLTRNVSNVAIYCDTKAFSIRGTVSGLYVGGTGLTIRNNAQDPISLTNGVFVFPYLYYYGTTYNVTIQSQPTGHTCTLVNPTGTVLANVTNIAVTCTRNGYSVGGSVSSLLGSGLILLNNGTGVPDYKIIASNGSFVFATNVMFQDYYLVTVYQQPDRSTCYVSPNVGVVTASVNTISITCFANSYPIKGNATGIPATGSGLVLTLNQGLSNLVLTQNGAFQFGNALTSGSMYNVSITAQPAYATCTVAGASGSVVNQAITSIVVTCTPNGFSVGGVVNDLVGTGLVLALNGGSENITVNVSGTFQFRTIISGGNNYFVQIAAQPSGSFCFVPYATSGGVVTTANITSVVVNCSATVFTVGGYLVGLPAGTSLVVGNSNGANATLTASGQWSFATKQLYGSLYNVSILTPANGSTCLVDPSYASGTVVGTTNSILIVCSIYQYTVGGNVINLFNPGLVLKNEVDGGTVTINKAGSWKFPYYLDFGTNYNVTVHTQPQGHTCNVSNGVDVVITDMLDVVVTCEPRYKYIGGTVTGLVGSGLRLILVDGDTNTLLSVDESSSSFEFESAPVIEGNTYAVYIDQQPTGSNCDISQNTGVAINNVTDVLITCSTGGGFTVGGVVSGLVGTGLVLRNGGMTRSIPYNAGFFFPAQDAGTAYDVVVDTQPSGSVCNVSNGSGTVTGTVTDVVVNCVVNNYTISGVVSGLQASQSFTLTNGFENITISTNGNFTFANLSFGTYYSVFVVTAPTGATCVVNNGQSASAVLNSDVFVNIVCVATAYQVQLSVINLNQVWTLVISNNISNGLTVDTLTLTRDGLYIFPIPVSHGTTYDIAITAQPSGQVCALSGAITGAMTGSLALVANCTTQYYAVAVNVTGLKAGATLEVKNLYTLDHVNITSNGTTVVTPGLLYSSQYYLTISLAPVEQNCSIVSAPNGTVTSNTFLDVSCVPYPFFVMGYLVGLESNGPLSLSNTKPSEVDNLIITANGIFIFTNPVYYGETYNVAVGISPPGQTCTISGGQGVAYSDIYSVIVTCQPASYSIGGSVTGLVWPGLVLANHNGDVLKIDSDGSFVFKFFVSYNTIYNVTVLLEPVGQTCSVTQGTGLVSANVTSVLVTCSEIDYYISGSVSGLLGTGLQLSAQNLNSSTSQALNIVNNGSFTFTTPFTYREAYTLSVQTQPSDAFCLFTSASQGVIESDQAVQVTCYPNGCKTCNMIASGNQVDTIYNGQFVLDPSQPFVNSKPHYVRSSFHLYGDSYGWYLDFDLIPGNGLSGYVFSPSFCPSDIALPWQFGISDNTYNFAPNCQAACNSCDLEVSGVTVNTLINGHYRYQGSYNNKLYYQQQFAPQYYLYGSANNASQSAYYFDNDLNATNGYFGRIFWQSLCAENINSQVVPWSMVNLTSQTFVPNFDVSIQVNCSSLFDALYYISGSVSGLVNPLTLVLNDNVTLPVVVTSSNPTFLFTEVPVLRTTTYNVTIPNQPAGQTCVVSNGYGIALNNVSNVMVSCSLNAYSVGVNITGVNLSSSVIIFNPTLNLNLSTDSLKASTWPQTQLYGSTLHAEIVQQPSNQFCYVRDDEKSGVMVLKDTYLNVICVNVITTPLSLGGTVTGYTPASPSPLILQNINATYLVSISKNGGFVFPATFAFGTTFNVTVNQQPIGLLCGVTQGYGSQIANVSSIVVTCTNHSYSVGGFVSGLAYSGSGTGLGYGLQLQLNSFLPFLSVSVNGAFVFPSLVPSLGSYGVTIVQQPQGQTCGVSVIGDGIARGNITNVGVVCTTIEYVLKFQVRNMYGKNLVIKNNGTGDNATASFTISSTGTFTLSTKLNYGNSYHLTVAQQPSGGTCGFFPSASGNGVITSNVSLVVDCIAKDCLLCSVEATGSNSGYNGLYNLLPDQYDGRPAYRNVANGLNLYAIGSTWLLDNDFDFDGGYFGFAYDPAFCPSEINTMWSVFDPTSELIEENITFTSICQKVTLGGTVSGLSSLGLSLSLLGLQTLYLSTNGLFVFPNPIVVGSRYDVEILTQPALEYCSLFNSSGVVPETNVMNIAVVCGPLPTCSDGASNGDEVAVDCGGSCAPCAWLVFGVVTGPENISSLVLRLTTVGGDQDLTIGTNGSYTFLATLTDGASWQVRVLTQPQGLLCYIAGTEDSVSGIATQPIDVPVTCFEIDYYIMGTVANLSPRSIVVQNTIGGGGVQVVNDGPWIIPFPVHFGQDYRLALAAQPIDRFCDIQPDEGVVTGNVSGILINCTLGVYGLSGEVTGLGGTIVLTNTITNESLTVTGTGSVVLFAFTLPVHIGDTWDLVIAQQPSGGAQCAFSRRQSGTASGSVTDILVACSNNTYYVWARVDGLRGATPELTLSLDSQTLSVTSNATRTYMFPNNVPYGMQYSLTIIPPIGQNCTADAPTGVIQRNITLEIECEPGVYTVCGTINGMVGTGLAMTNRGYLSNRPLTFAQGGKWTFDAPMDPKMNLTITKQPTGSTCFVIEGIGEGYLAGSDGTCPGIINCTTAVFTVSGTVTGLTGTDLVLIDQAGNKIRINSDGTFTFSTNVTANGDYLVLIEKQPTNATTICNITKNSGQATQTIYDVTIDCRNVTSPGRRGPKKPSQLISGLDNSTLWIIVAVALGLVAIVIIVLCWFCIKNMRQVHALEGRHAGEMAMHGGDIELRDQEHHKMLRQHDSEDF